MPSTSLKQQRFMRADLGRLRKGQKTRTGMSERQLHDFASQVRAVKKKIKKK